MRRAAKVDANHDEIVCALRKAGVMVLSLAALGAGVPDLLCCLRGRLVLVEVKDGAKSPSRRSLTPAQADWHRAWSSAPLFVVQTPYDALKALELMP